MHLERVGLSGNSLGRPFLLKKLFHCLAALANGIRLPRTVYAAGICLVKRGRAVDVKADNECANAEGPSAAALRVLLLDARDISSDVPAQMQRQEERTRWEPCGARRLNDAKRWCCLLYARSVFKRQAVRLALNAGVVDENAAVCSETSECNGKMRVELANFTDGVRLWVGVRMSGGGGA